MTKHYLALLCRNSKLYGCTNSNCSYPADCNYSQNPKIDRKIYRLILTINSLKLFCYLRAVSASTATSRTTKCITSTSFVFKFQVINFHKNIV